MGHVEFWEGGREGGRGGREGREGGREPEGGREGGRGREWGERVGGKEAEGGRETEGRAFTVAAVTVAAAACSALQPPAPRSRHAALSRSRTMCTRYRVYTREHELVGSRTYMFCHR